MNIGLFLAYWPWFTLDEQLELAVLADDLGMDSVWVAGGVGAGRGLGARAARGPDRARRARAPGLMQIPARQPTATAMAAATLDVMSGGRFRLGLGVSGPQVSEGWYGVPFARPLAPHARVRGDRARGAGPRRAARVRRRATGRCRCPDGLGQPLKLLARPVQERIPIYLGAVGPNAVEQAGEIADGWLPFMLDPDAARSSSRARGLGKRGPRTAPTSTSPPCVPLAIADDVAAARDAVRPWLAFYLGAMGAPSKNFYVEAGRRATATATPPARCQERVPGRRPRRRRARRSRRD